MQKLIGRCRKTSVLVGAAMGSLSFATAGLADCTSQQLGNLSITNAQLLTIPTSATASTLSSAIGNVNTIFLTQQGSAFVSAPGNAAPDQPGGGVWARGVGGETKTRSASSSTTIGQPAGLALTAVTATNCTNSQRDSFAGAQVGADIARLNWDGWNVHLGTTAGYLGSKSNDEFGFSNSVQVPFFGTYLVATKGRFFADLMVRQEVYSVNLSNPAFTFFDQPISAHGYSISTSAGYNFDAGQGWFIEPSAGFVYSRTSVDSFTSSGTLALPISGAVSTDDITSEIGRLSLRAGKVIETPNVIWQPFASASVFHEFGGKVVTNYASLPNAAFFIPAGGGAFVPSAITQSTSTSRVGTYGQYSLGVAAQGVGTGLLGFVRVDYRDGQNLRGWTGNGGIRYQFTPEMIASAMPVKAKAPPRPLVGPTNWTGFYVGGFAGAAGGRTDIGFVGDPTSGGRPWVSGAIGGLQAGYNHQFPTNWVLGVEGDVGGANVRGGRRAGAADGLVATPVGSLSTGFSPAFYTVQDKTNWMATAAARVGYTWGRTLFYVKGGAAFEDSSTSVECTFGPIGALAAPAPSNPKLCRNQAGANVAAFSTSSYTRIGWTLGYGTEFDLGRNLSAKGEYSYVSFGRHTALASDGATFMTDKSSVSQVKVGLNYRFTPSVAR